MRRGIRRHNLSPIGIDFGTRAIKAVQLARDGSAPWSVRAAMMLDRTSPGPEIDPSDAPRLQTALRRHGFVGSVAVAASPSWATVTAVLDLPASTAPSASADAARFELARTHRLDAQHMELACWRIDGAIERAGNVPTMAAACEHDQADALLDALESAGLEIAALDVDANALARSCTALKQPDESSLVAVADLGWDAAGFVLLHNDQVVYERRLESAGLHRLIDQLKDQTGLDDMVIEYLLFDLGFEIDVHGQSTDWALFAKVRPHVEAHFAGLVNELELSISYGSHQYPNEAVDRLILTGGGAAVPGLAGHLAMSVEPQIDVARLNRLATCDDDELPVAPSPALATAVGLAMYDLEPKV